MVDSFVCESLGYALTYHAKPEWKGFMYSFVGVL